MRKTLPVVAPGIAAKLTAFVLERYPFAVTLVQHSLDDSAGAPAQGDAAATDAFRCRFLARLDRALSALSVNDGPDPTPGVSAAARLDQARREFREACDGFLVRQALIASLTREERCEILRGMVLTRAIDNR